jgi:large subunit ribosomal protein LP0
MSLTFVSFSKAKEYLANPDAFVVAAPVAEAAPAVAEKVEEEKVEEKDESDDDMVSHPPFMNVNAFKD